VLIQLMLLSLHSRQSSAPCKMPSPASARPALLREATTAESDKL
jgi:hypothetical protein